MPRYFGSNPDMQPAPTQDNPQGVTYYAGVDVNHYGTVIAAAVTHDINLITDEFGKK